MTYQFVGDLRLFEEPVLLVGQRRVRLVEARALVPQSAQQVFLLEQRVDLTQRVQRLLKAARQPVSQSVSQSGQARRDVTRHVKYIHNVCRVM